MALLRLKKRLHENALQKPDFATVFRKVWRPASKLVDSIYSCSELAHETLDIWGKASQRAITSPRGMLSQVLLDGGMGTSENIDGTIPDVGKNTWVSIAILNGTLARIRVFLFPSDRPLKTSYVRHERNSHILSSVA